MKLPFLGAISARVIDERFLDHRRRSSTFVVIAGALVSGALFEYHLFRDRRIDWELFSVLGAMLVAKLSAMTWYHFTD